LLERFHFEYAPIENSQKTSKGMFGSGAVQETKGPCLLSAEEL
jgi:hypothetical protein